MLTSKSHVMTFLVVLVLSALAQAQTFSTLYSFTGGSDGSFPDAGVIQDAAGNLYGTTLYGGDLNCGAGSGCGVVYKLDTAGTETVLHSFTGSPDAMEPAAPVTRDRAGNIYGTAYYGGLVGLGAVFKIDTAGNETVLYNLDGGIDGCYPLQGVLRDKDGNLYGTTTDCYPNGSIFMLDSAGTFTLLHDFGGSPSDGARPAFGHLTVDKSGNLYGLTVYGGTHNAGVLYKLSKNATFTVLHSFAADATDGCNPVGSVVQDKSGNFYGTTYQCGSHNNYGTIWKVSNTGKETILHNFVGGTSDGCTPPAGIARDSKGNMYGVTVACGANNYGTVYKLSAGGRLTLLHSFDYSDGYWPTGEVLRSTKGTLFGTTMGGPAGYCDGAPACGTVWSYVP